MKSSTEYQVKELQHIEQWSIAFFDRRVFRISYPFSIAVDSPRVIKFSAPCEFILRSQVVSVNENGVSYEAIVGGTPSGVFSAPITAWGVNRMIEVQSAPYVGQVTVSTGGEVTGGLVAETLIVAGSNQSPTVVESISSPRGLPVGDYYLRMTASGGTATGTLALLWEERP